MKKDILQETFEKHVRLMKEKLNLTNSFLTETETEDANAKIVKYIEGGMKGDLEINDPSIETLPDSLTHVGGSLVLYARNLKSLGGLQKVDGNLNLTGLPEIEALPDSLKYVGGNIEAGSCKKLKSLGGLEKVVGKIEIHSTLVEAFPDSLKYVGQFDWSGARSFKSLGRGLQMVGKTLKLYGNKMITEIPDSLTHVGGNLDAFNCQNLKSLGKIQEIGGNLNIVNTLVEIIPRSLKSVGGKIETNNRDLKIPEHFRSEPDDDAPFGDDSAKKIKFFNMGGASIHKGEFHGSWEYY